MDKEKWHEQRKLTWAKRIDMNKGNWHEQRELACTRSDELWNDGFVETDAERLIRKEVML